MAAAIVFRARRLVVMEAAVETALPVPVEAMRVVALADTGQAVAKAARVSTRDRREDSRRAAQPAVLAAQPAVLAAVNLGAQWADNPAAELLVARRAAAQAAHLAAELPFRSSIRKL